MIKNRISVVIPVYNGHLSLKELSMKLNKTLTKICPEHEIILIDDGSQDNSWQIIQELHKEHSNIKGIKLKMNYGQQSAILCGLSKAAFEYIVTMDDDLQHNPHDLLHLIKEVEKGYDVVYGVSKTRYHSPYRVMGSKITDKLFNILLKKPDHIKISSFRVMRKETAQKIMIASRDYGYVYISAATFKVTNRIQSIYITHNKRKYGTSNYHFYKLLKIFIKIYIYYSQNPLCKLFRKTEPIYEIEENTFLK